MWHSFSSMESVMSSSIPTTPPNSIENGINEKSTKMNTSILNLTPSNNTAAQLSFYEDVYRPGQPIIKKIKKFMAARKIFYSFEYFPPKTREGVKNLYDRIERMSLLEPLFMDITWGAGGSTSALTLEIATAAQHMASECMMHLTCTNMSVKEIKRALDAAKDAGVRNILALRGDPPKGMESWEACDDGFEHAIDLVRYIRKEYGNLFGIAVAGYPEGHIQMQSLEDDIQHLKNKVDAGADFIITQLFYDVNLFLEWRSKCIAAGITVPILPGIMPIQNYNGFKRMTNFCRTHVPLEIEDALQPIQENDEMVKHYGVKLAEQMCRQLLAAGVPGLHFYTLNLEKSVTETLECLGYVTASGLHSLPWKQSLVSRRKKEDVRPIFWANRPKSYVDRTIHWDEFPNGRWGDSTSPAYGDLSDYHLVGFKAGSQAERLKYWGSALEKPLDVYEVFVDFIKGNIPRLPWCENTVQPETDLIKSHLIQLNRNGFLTINSQPRVNGAPSSDAAVGWGPSDGYVYQKAYLEFFTSSSNLERLQKLAQTHTSIAYMAVDSQGHSVSNVQLVSKPVVNAVTWGVFPNKEIIQPTVVDTQSFMAWKDEAFALWISQWRDIYPADSISYALIQQLHDTYFLVNVVDNNFVDGDLWATIMKLIV